MNECLPKLLRAIAGSTAAKQNKHDVIFNAAANELEQLRNSKEASRATIPPKMTDDEVISLLQSGVAHPIERARRKFSEWSGRIEQAGLQRTGLRPIQMRRMEFQAVQEILMAFNGQEPKSF